MGRDRPAPGAEFSIRVSGGLLRIGPRAAGGAPARFRGRSSIFDRRFDRRVIGV
jgi:hypothetical protein